MDTIKSGNRKRSVIAVLVGLIVSILLILVLGIIFAAFLTFTPLSEGKIAIGSLLIIAISLLAGGIVTAMIAENKGLYHGLALGICFLFILLICAKQTGAFVLSAFCLRSAIALIAAALGGILGIKK